MGGECQPFELAEIPSEDAASLGLSPAFVLVGGRRGANGGSAAIYIVDKASGEVTLTRPQRSDSSEPVRLAATRTTIVAIDQYDPANDARFLGHCTLANCDDASPAPGSYAFNHIRDFAFDEATARAYWFDNSTGELTFTLVDDWHPTSLGAITADSDDPNNYPKAVASDGTRLYGSFEYSIDSVRVDGTSAPVPVSGYPSAETTSAQEVAATSDSLVLLYPQSGNVYRVPLPEGIGNLEPNSIRAVAGASHLATSGSTLFWSQTSTLLKCTLPLCSSVQTLAADRAVIWALTADDTAVYWLSQPNVAGTTAVSIMRLAR